MKIFFGAAIQGHQKTDERSHVYRLILKTITDLGHTAYAEHTRGETTEEILALMDEAIGPLSKNTEERVIQVRNKMIEGVEGDIDAAIFELSTPSLGTGIEFAHAYLRPRMGLKPIPILALYEKDYWPRNLSSMIRGITPERVKEVQLSVYGSETEAVRLVQGFLGDIS